MPVKIKGSRVHFQEVKVNSKSLISYCKVGLLKMKDFSFHSFQNWLFLLRVIYLFFFYTVDD